MISEEDGQKLLQLAKRAVISGLEGKECHADKTLASKLPELRGCFVTLHKNGQLRGCIGFPEPVMPLCSAIISAARAAAFEDPRFPLLSKGELTEIDFEISVLSKPELMKVSKPDDYLKKIEAGSDGLIIRGAYGSGLLLPQVATEHGWDAKTFLEHTCIKAGLHKDAWKDLNNKIYTFQAQIFSEDTVTRAYNRRRDITGPKDIKMGLLPSA